MNRTQLKNQHLALNEKEPFTEIEQNEYNKKDRSMIRNIQILNGIKKKDAIAVLHAYKSTPKQTLKRLAKAYRERLNKYSSPQKPDNRGEIIAPKVKKGKKHEKQIGNKESLIFTANRKSVVEYIKKSSNKKDKTYVRIEKAHKKYINASRYELRQGVNSKKAQKYREKQGLSKKYTGRIIK